MVSNVCSDVKSFPLVCQHWAFINIDELSVFSVIVNLLPLPHGIFNALTRSTLMLTTQPTLLYQCRWSAKTSSIEHLNLLHAVRLQWSWVHYILDLIALELASQSFLQCRLYRDTALWNTTLDTYDCRTHCVSSMNKCLEWRYCKKCTRVVELYPTVVCSRGGVHCHCYWIEACSAIPRNSLLALRIILIM